MNSLQKFNNLVMEHATPIFNSAKQNVDSIRNRYTHMMHNVKEEVVSSYVKIAGKDGSHLLGVAIEVAPITIAILATMTYLSTPALVLVGTLGAAAAVLQPDGLTNHCKQSVVASALCADIAITAVKVVTALAAIDFGAALLALAVGGGLGVGLYAGYQWLSKPTQYDSIHDCLNAIVDPFHREALKKYFTAQLNR